MTHSHRQVDIHALREQLTNAVSNGGARASRLLRYTPDIIDVLYPATDHPELSAYQLAFRVEHDIREAIDAIAGPAAQALGAILCLHPGLLGRKLEHRRRIAASHFDIEPDTFRRSWHEEALLFDLAIEICRIHEHKST